VTVDGSTFTALLFCTEHGTPVQIGSAMWTGGVVDNRVVLLNIVTIASLEPLEGYVSWVDDINKILKGTKEDS
jgi:hypothetical protein